MAIPRPEVRLRRWLAAIALGIVVLAAALLLLLRTRFDGPDLGDSLGSMLSQKMRGKVAIGSVEWPMSALETAVRGGWVPVTVRDVEVWDDKGVSVLTTPLITAEIDIHSLMFGRHDIVLRHIVVKSGHVLLREISEPYPLHDYDTTVFSLLAAFYGKRSRAGYYVGVQATSAPRFDLQDYRLEDVDLDIRLKPYGKDGQSYQFRALLENVSSTGYLYMDPSDPIVPKFYTSLRPKAEGGQIDLFYEPRSDGAWRADYSIPLAKLDVTQLRQVPAEWPASPVANTLEFALTAETRDGAHATVHGYMFDYWADAYDGRWDVKVEVKNAGPMLKHTFDPDIGGDDVTLEARITGPIVAYPKIDLTLRGLTYNLTLVEPPLHLELDTLRVGYDLVVDRGQIDEFVARGAGGKLTIRGTFGGDGSNEAPFMVDGEVRIDEPVDMKGRLPPCLEGTFGSKLSGHLQVSRQKGDTALVFAVHDFVFKLGKLTVAGTRIFSDVTFGKVTLEGVYAEFEGTTGTVSGDIDTTTGELALKGRTRSKNFQGLIAQINCATPTKPKAKAPARAAARPAAKQPTASKPVARAPVQPRPLRPTRLRPTRRPLVQGQPAPAKPRPTKPPAGPSRDQTSGEIEFEITGTVDAPRVKTAASLDQVPYVGRLRGNVTYEGDVVELTNAYATSLGGKLSASGRVRLAPATVIENLRLRATSVDLARLRDPVPGLTGKVSADLTLRGPPDPRRIDASGWACSPRVTFGGDVYTDVGLWLARTPGVLDACGKLAAPALEAPVQQACTSVARAGGRCVIARARREAGGELALAASIDRADRLGGAAMIRGLPLAALASLAGAALPAGAILDSEPGGLALGGTLAAPELGGALAISRAWAAGAHLGDGRLEVRPAGRGKVELAVTLLDGRLAVRGTLGTVAPYPVELTADVDQLELDTFVDVTTLGLPAGTRAWTSGRVQVKTTLGGETAPMVATLALRELSISTALPGPDGEPVPLTLRAAAPLEVAYDGKEARIVGTARFTTPFGALAVEGRAGGATVDLSARGQIDLTRAQPLLGGYFERTTGGASLVARVSGFTVDPRVQATLDLADVALHLPRQDAVLRVPRGRIDLSNRELSFTGVAVEVDDGFSAERPTLEVKGGIALSGLRPDRWTVIVDGELAGEMLLAVAPEALAQASGTADVELTLSGTGPVPTVKGELTFDRDQPLTVLPRSLRREIVLTEGDVTFTTSRITFADVGATVDDEGRLRGISGYLDLRGGTLAAAELTAAADALPFRFGRALDLVLDVPELRLALGPGGLDLRGEVTVVDGRFTQNFDLGEFLRPAAPSGPESAPLWESFPPLGDARLAIAVDIRRFTALSNLFTLDASGAVAISGSPRDPRLGGTMQVSNGSFRFPGARARFTRARGDASFNPLVPLSSDTIELAITSEADYRDPSGQDHLITLELAGPLARLTWDLSTTSGLNKGQSLQLILAGRTPEELRRSLGTAAIGSDPTKIDPSTDTSQGYTDELVRQLAGDYLTRGVADTLRDLSGLDVARIELNLASFGFHGEKELFERIDLIGDLERTARGLTINGRAEVRFREPFWGRVVFGQVSYLRKDYDDAAERDVNDVELKLIVRRVLGQ